MKYDAYFFPFVKIRKHVSNSFLHTLFPITFLCRWDFTAVFTHKFVVLQFGAHH